MADWSPRANDIFLKALELPPAISRDRFLERECGQDAQLRGQVDQLLVASERAGGFLESPATGLVATLATVETVPDNQIPRTGTQIGSYKLLERIGEGGFGSVYLAEQSEPVRRSVALKIIKLGMDTRQVIARFEAERQALAMMDHPNIARVLDAGATETGRPYFVMELVKGVPITQYCDDHRVALPERLTLFTDVCYAVQHAHQKGIIHRDLKPSNVLVSRHDDRPVVKVIDFGIAKATGVRLTDKSLHTEWRQLVGTPTYMSPEQAGMSDLDVDTRSDIYALGVLLYELLTGTTPFDKQALLSSGFDEMRRVIREVEPEKPSTRVGSVAARLASGPRSSETSSSRTPSSSARPPGPVNSSVAKNVPHAKLPAGSPSANAVSSVRRIDSKLLSRQLRGDLDWIVMKCLEKDRTRRYETADALALEVKRYGKNEPVLAGPPSRVYRFRKFVRRNRGTVAAAAVVAVALLAGISGTTFGLLQAEKRRVQAEAAQVREREQRELAEKREKQTQQVSEFQGAILGGIDVEAMGRGIKQRLRDQVRSALEREYVGEFPNRRKRTPEEIEAELVAFDQRAAAAEGADVARGVIDEFVLARAAVALEKEFADQPLVRAQLHEDIGGNYEKLGLYAAAEPHFRSALELRKRELGDVHELVAYSLHDLAALWIYQGNYAAAEPMLRQALALYRNLHGDGCSHAADALCNLALVSNHNGDFAEAERLTREALAVRRTRFGDQHPDVALSMADLALALVKRGNSAAADPLYREALTIARSAPGDQSSLIARILNDMAVMIWTRDAAEAERLLREALAMKRALVGDEHPGVALTLHDLGLLLLEKRDYAAAETPLREVLAIRRKLFGDHHPNVALDLGTLAELLRQQRDYAGAAPLFREALAILRLSDDLPNLAWTLHHLADCLRATGVLEEAEELARHALDIYRANVHTWPGQRGEHRHATDVLSQTLVDAGKPDDAIVVRREFVEDVRRVLPVEDLSFASDLGRLGLLLLQQNRYAEAEPILRECREIRDKALKPESLDYWLLANTRSMLGGALGGQGAALIKSNAPAAIAKFTEAEGLLVDASEWLTQNADRIPQQYRAERLREALERAVKLYESWDAVAPGTGQAEQAAKWRAKLENLPRP